MKFKVDLLNTNIDKIICELSRNILSGSEVSEILNNPKEFPTPFIEKLTIEIAIKYWNKVINYKDADCAMNNIYTFWITNEHYYTNYGFSDIAWECYEAFDSGEYFRDDDEKDVDPVEKYTNPLIEEFLKKLKCIK